MFCATYIFFRRAIVVLVGLDANESSLLHLDLEHGLVCHGLVDLVLLAVAVEGSSTLGKLFALVGKELLLVVETVRDVAVVVPLVLDHAIKEVLVLSLGRSGVEFVLEVRILFEHSLALVVVADDLFRLEHADCALLDVKFDARLGRADRRLVSQLRPIQFDRVGHGFASQASLDGRYGIQTAIVVITN